MKKLISILTIASVVVFLTRPVWADSTTKIYWAVNDTGKIQQANLDGSDIEDVVIGLSHPQNIDFDLSGGKIYWTDSGTNKIQRANMDGSNVEDVITGLSSPYGISLDTVGQKIYWTNTSNCKIQRANFDGTNIEDLITNYGEYPYDIGLDLFEGKMYWNYGTAIYRANLDGTDMELPAGSSYGNTTSIDLDVTSGKIYLTVAELPYTVYYGYLQRVDMDGSNHENLYYAENFCPYGIALDIPGGKMYWAEDVNNKIQRANLDGSDVEDVITGLTGSASPAIPKSPVMDDLEVRPFDRFKPNGGKGGPFTPQSTTYTLINTGHSSIDWTASSNWSWLDISPASGTLGPNEVNTVQISINLTANELDYGTYADTLIITDLTSGKTKGRNIELMVMPYHKIYWTDSQNGKIQCCDLSGNNVEDLITSGLSSPDGIAVDYGNFKMYWTDVGTDKIQRAGLDGTEVEDILTGRNNPHSIAVDTYNGKVYWSEPDSIYRANTDGSNIETILTGYPNITSIDLDVLSGYIYWTQRNGGYIRRSTLDGSYTTTLDNYNWKRCICLELRSRKMYWTKLFSYEIGRCDLNASNSEDLAIVSSSPYYIALDTFVDKMYWTQPDTHKIQRANMDGSDVEEVVTGLGSPQGIAIPKFHEINDVEVIPFVAFNSQGDVGGPFTPESFSYTLTNTGSESIDWTASVTQGWLDISAMSGTLGPNDFTSIQININSNAEELNYGAYSDWLTVTNLTSGIVQNRAIKLRVFGPIIALSQKEFYFEAQQDGKNPPSQVLGISNIGSGVLNWQITQTSGWLSTDPYRGSTTSEVDEVNIIVDINGLTSGRDSCVLLVSDGNAENSPQSFRVDLKVMPHLISEFKITASDGEFEDQFGYSVSIDGDRCIVGASWEGDEEPYSGSAYIFEFDGTDWIEHTKLKASDANSQDIFGTSVDIDGDRCIAGGCDNSMEPYHKGRVYLFEWNGTAWIEQQKLTISEGVETDFFGLSVAISGNRCIVGDFGDDDYGTESGAAYIFEWNGTEWTQQAKLTALDGEEMDRFGCAVDIDGDRCVVGAWYDNGYNGSAYIFEWDGSVWNQKAKLVPSDETYYFGYSVSISGDRCLVGSVYDSDIGNQSGSAFIFEWNGTTWIQQDKLLASDGDAGDYFGHSVSIDGDRCIVGATGDDINGNNSGSAYIYDWDGMTWVEQKLAASDGVAYDSYGGSVSICNNRFLIGAASDDDKGNSSGSAYVYHYYYSSDLDKNFAVDFYDFAIFASQWLQGPGVPSADISPPEGDGFVDYNDLDIFYLDWLEGLTE